MLKDGLFENVCHCHADLEHSWFLSSCGCVRYSPGISAHHPYQNLNLLALSAAKAQLFEQFKTLVFVNL